MFGTKEWIFRFLRKDSVSSTKCRNENIHQDPKFSLTQRKARAHQSSRERGGRRERETQEATESPNRATSVGAIALRSRRRRLYRAASRHAGLPSIQLELPTAVAGYSSFLMPSQSFLARSRGRSSFPQIWR
jgi:hypothetical protein